MKLHRMNAEIVVQGLNGEKVMKPIQVLANPTEVMGIYKDDTSGRYIVSHIPTGYKIAGTRTQLTAREVMWRLLALGIDWRESNPDNLRSFLSESAHSSIVEIIDEYRGQ